MRFLILAAAALLGLLMILVTFARHVADSTSWDRSNDVIWADNVLWVVLLLLWALGVMLATA